MVIDTNPTHRLAQWRSAASPEHVRYGRDWYTRGTARTFTRAMAAEHGITLTQANGITAAFSPNAAWNSNQTMVRRFLADPTRRAGLGRACAQAKAILAGRRPLDVLTGPKVRAFYRALQGDRTAVVIDLWHARAAGMDPDRLTDTRRAAITAATHEVARQFGDHPRDCQAIIWCAIRGAHN